MAVKISGYMVDKGFVRVCASLVRTAATQSEFQLEWAEHAIDVCNEKVSIRYGRASKNGVVKDLAIVMASSRAIGILDEIARLGVKVGQTVLIATATEDQARALRQNGRVGEHGYAIMNNEPVPGLIGVNRAALICDGAFKPEKLVADLFETFVFGRPTAPSALSAHEAVIATENPVPSAG